MPVFRDVTNNITFSRPARFLIRDRDTGTQHEAVDAVHGAEILGALTGSPVSSHMFYSLRSKSGTRAGALRYRFDVEKNTAKQGGIAAC